MGWGSCHPFFCFLPFSVLTSRACKIPSARNCIEKNFLTGERPVSWRRRLRGSSKQHGVKSRSHSSLERATATARARKQVLDEKNKESWSSGFDIFASNFTQADWCVQEKDALCSVRPYFILYQMSFDRRTYKDHYEKFTNVHDEVGNLEHTDILQVGDSSVQKSCHCDFRSVFVGDSNSSHLLLNLHETTINIK